MSKQAVVLLSGGIDSTTCLAHAVELHGASNVLALSLLYGQKHDRELQAAKDVAEYYHVQRIEWDMSGAFAFSDCPLLKQGGKIKHESYADQLAELGGEGTVDTYVPFRNGLFLSTAAAIALSFGARYIYYGAHADDAAGRAYPDCTPEFFNSMKEAVYFGSGEKLTLIAPLLYKNKAEVVGLGLELNAPYHLTWSCYEGLNKPCGTCGTCIDRAKAFEANGIKDPALEVQS